MRRVFLGLEPPEPLRQALAVQQFLLPLPRRVDPDSFHLTLVFLGELSDPALEAAHESFAALRAAPFTLTLQGLGLFGGARPRTAWAGVAPCDALMRLQARAEHAARAAGLDPEHRRFHPHVTLGRFSPPDFAATARLERAVAEGAGFAAGPWPVQEMVLWQSLAASGGRVYRDLARYPLG